MTNELLLSQASAFVDIAFRSGDGCTIWAPEGQFEKLLRGELDRGSGQDLLTPKVAKQTLPFSVPTDNSYNAARNLTSMSRHSALICTDLWHITKLQGYVTTKRKVLSFSPILRMQEVLTYTFPPLHNI